ncbi:TAXI family TRAP transporter solute-binding subunit [Planosporangium flavigriseum]|uniref:TAXI family TRAP transporter solute-binding subunit n=1 Tax=Planosporangium flavigriseum TaxID=373681 RepID=UPI001EF2440B|nr:TAXI family TRAP transporter solute-binding subunit [Planosporangium flavigriseum]
MRVRALVCTLVVAVALTGCANAAAAPRRWHEGRLFLATGNTSGTFYQLGGGYADLVSTYLPGYEVRAEPSGASGDNVDRLASGDMELALCSGDTAADAAEGRGPYAGKPQPIRALARLYRNTMNVVVRTDAKIRKVADLRGRRVSTGTLNSSTDLLAGRMLEAAGLNPDTDIQRLRTSLPDTVNGMRAGSVDALFFTGGLPTPGITDLLDSAPGKFALLPAGDVVEPLAAKYGSVYSKATISKDVYHTEADVEAIVLPTLLLVPADMPDDLAYNLTKVLFEHQAELAKVHPEGANFDRASGAQTQPVPLHPGARRYYQGR